MDLGATWLCQPAPEFCRALDHLKSIHKLPAGALIAERGKPADRLVFLEDGQVQLTRTGSGRSSATLITGRVVIGLNEVLTGSEYELSVCAYSDVKLSCIARVSLLRFLCQNPEICMSLVRSLSEDLLSLHRGMGNLRTPTRRRRKPK